MEKKEQTSSTTRAYIRFGRLCFNLVFNDDVNFIRQKFKLKTNGSVLPKYKADFKKLVEALINKYKLFALPLEPLCDYIMDKDFKYNDKLNYSLSDEESYIIYKIYPDTTTKDILYDWPKITKLQEKIYGGKIKKNYPQINRDRDLSINTLKILGFSCKGITKIINGLYENQVISYQEVSKIICRFANPPQ